MATPAASRRKQRPKRPRKPFLDLPAELRNSIYEYVAHSTKDSEVNIIYGKLSASSLHLGATCHQVRREFLPIFQDFAARHVDVFNVQVVDLDFDDLHKLTAGLLRGPACVRYFGRAMNVWLRFTWPLEDVSVASLYRWVRFCMTVMPQGKGSIPQLYTATFGKGIDADEAEEMLEGIRLEMAKHGELVGRLHWWCVDEGLNEACADLREKEEKEG